MRKQKQIFENRALLRAYEAYFPYWTNTYNAGKYYSTSKKTHGGNIERLTHSLQDKKYLEKKRRLPKAYIKRNSKWKWVDSKRKGEAFRGKTDLFFDYLEHKKSIKVNDNSSKRLIEFILSFEEIREYIIKEVDGANICEKIHNYLLSRLVAKWLELYTGEQNTFINEKYTDEQKRVLDLLNEGKSNRLLPPYYSLLRIYLEIKLNDAESTFYSEKIKSFENLKDKSEYLITELRRLVSASIQRNNDNQKFHHEKVIEYDRNRILRETVEFIALRSLNIEVFETVALIAEGVTRQVMEFQIRNQFVKYTKDYSESFWEDKRVINETASILQVLLKSRDWKDKIARVINTVVETDYLPPCIELSKYISILNGGNKDEIMNDKINEIKTNLISEGIKKFNKKLVQEIIKTNKKNI